MDMAVELTHKQALNREKDIHEELQRLKAKTEKTDEDRAKVPLLVKEFREVHQHRLDLEHDAALAEVRSAGGAPKAGDDTEDDELVTERGSQDDDDESDGDEVDERRFRHSRRGRNGRFRNPWDISGVRVFGRDGETVATEFRERALDAIERMRAPSFGSRGGEGLKGHNGVTSDRVREVCTQLIEECGDEQESRLSKLALATSSPDYMRAFAKLMKTRGQIGVLSNDEKRAYERAMTLTDTAGGFLVPFQLDPTVILTAAGSRNNVRQISRVVQATGDEWAGITSAGVTGSWDPESTEVSDDSPTVGQPKVPVHKGAIFVPITIEASQDEANVGNEVARMVAFEKDRMESVAFVTGTGTNQPTGIITALTGTASELASGTPDAFLVGDVYKLDGDLPDRWAEGATWVANRKVYNLVRQFDTQGGPNLWGYIGEARRPELLGRPAVTAEAMDGVLDAGQNNRILLFGDFENFVIADRVGTTVEYIPHLFGPSGRPIGQRGWYAYFRVGSDSVNDAAFRMLNS